MDNFLNFLKFSFNFTQLDLIFSPQNFTNLNSTYEKFIFILKNLFFAYVLLTVSFIIYIFSTLLFVTPFDPKYLGETFYNTSSLFITLIEILRLFIYRENIKKLSEKLPENFTNDEIEKFKLKNVILRTKMIYSTPGVLGVIAVTFYIIKNLNKRKFFIDFTFPFDISRPLVFYFINFDFLLVLFIFHFYVVVTQVYKYGLITVTSVEFMKLKEEFKNLRKEVRIKNLKIF